MEPIYFKNREEWRRWLSKNHSEMKEIWMLYYKKHTGKGGVTYKESVEEALCYGWIDGKMKRIDEEKHMQRFTPRGPKSIWSKVNKAIALRLIKEGKMTPAGSAVIKVAKKNGNWQKAYAMTDTPKLPIELEDSLKKNKKAWSNFQGFTNGYQNMYIAWVNDAKRIETREKRIKEVVDRSAKSIKPFM